MATLLIAFDDAELHGRKVIRSEEVERGLCETLATLDDVNIDNPKATSMIADIAGRLVSAGCVPLSFVRKALDPTIAAGSREAGKFVGRMLQKVQSDSDSKVVALLWKETGLDLKEFLSDQSDETLAKWLDEYVSYYRVSGMSEVKRFF